MKKMRKKGAVIIEFLVILPVFMLVLWTVMQSMLFLQSTKLTKEVAVEASRVLAMEMRGHEGAFPNNPAMLNQIEKKLLNKTMAVTQYNRFTLLHANIDGAVCSPSTPDVCPEVVLKMTMDPNDGCYDVINTLGEKTRFICAYVETTQAGDREHEQIVVMVQSQFRLIGNFVPKWNGLIPIRAKGHAQKELTEPYNYYN